MSTTVKMISQTIECDGTTSTELANVVLDRGTVIQIISTNCAAKDACVITDASGGVIFSSAAPASNTWNDRAVLNRQVRGPVITTMGAAAAKIYFFLPSGRLS